MRKDIYRIEDLVIDAENAGVPLWQVVLDSEETNFNIERSLLWERMREIWKVMRQSVSHGVEQGIKSLSGLVGEEGVLFLDYLNKGMTLSGEGTVLAAARALGVAALNSSMGRIVAAPTAGSCGILPAVLLTVAERAGKEEDDVIKALFTAAGIGLVIDEVASTAGAQGGCQVECGTASCMAAAAAVEMAGGTPRQAVNAGAIALKCMMGLVCDPVAGLVEIPCVKRNAASTAVALLSADMALAGIESKIPIDEVVGAMKEVAGMMPAALRETAEGGLANTPTARSIEDRIFRRCSRQ
ncbi:MAG: L-serine ammonia-lyase, iron-sulfur-dependent, subunit alpha [Syntrophaceticus sp.]